jgi:hypothetical protein
VIVPLIGLHEGGSTRDSRWLQQQLTPTAKPTHITNELPPIFVQGRRNEGHHDFSNCRQLQVFIVFPAISPIQLDVVHNVFQEVILHLNTENIHVQDHTDVNTYLYTMEKEFSIMIENNNEKERVW